MATANRVILIASGLLLMILGTTVIAAVQLNAPGVIDRSSDFASWLDGRKLSSFRLVTTIVAGVAVALAAALLVCEWRLLRAPRQIRFRSASGETVIVPAASAEQILSSDIELVAHVSGARASVVPHGSTAEVAVDLDLDPHAVISEVAREVSRQVSATMTEKLGVALRGRPTVAVHYDELVLRQRSTAAVDGSTPLDVDGRLFEEPTETPR